MLSLSTTTKGSRLKHLRKMLHQTAKNLESFTHPRASVAWQDLDLVFRKVYNPSPDLPMDIVGKKVEDFIEDKDRARELNGLKQQIIETATPHHEVIHVTLGGRDHMYDISIEPTYDEQGEMDGLITITIDLTDLMTARRELDEANNRLVKLLSETLDDGPKVRHPGARL